MKQIKLSQIGWLIMGEATIKAWGGGQGTIKMDAERIPLGKLTKGSLLGAVNDGGFGCQSIEKADIDVYELYEGGHKRFRTTITAGKQYSKHFLQWKKYGTIYKELAG